MDRLRILVLYSHGNLTLDPNGIMAGTEGSTTHQAEYLAQCGHEVTIVTRLASPDGVYRGVRYIDCGPNPALLTPRVRDEDWDVALVVSSPRVLMTTYRLPYLRLRLLSIHIPPLPTLDHAPDPKRVKAMNSYADVVLCVSRALAHLLISHGVRPEKVHVVHNGVDHRVFYPHSLPRRMRRLVFAGALVPLKGIDTLLQAFQQVKAHIHDAELVICGSADLYGRQPYQWDESILPSDGSVQFRGKLSQSELAREFSQAALVIVPSSAKRCFEGFGMVSVEAQACACPVVVSDNGGLPETVLEGVTGRVCPADNPDALARLMVELLSAPEHLRSMGEAAARHIRQNFMWEHTLQPLARLVEQEARGHSLASRIRYAERCMRLVLERVPVRVRTRGGLPGPRKLGEAQR
jgi:glycosyltransferase involved in cell wall biosynthesis